MPTIHEVTAPLANICTSVPPASADVCDVCHGKPTPGFARCYSCEQTTSQVSTPCETVVPISLYQSLSQLHYCLRSYKDSPYSQVRARIGLQVAALLARFLRDHGDCIAGSVGPWDYITTVPSSSGRGGALHPLEAAFGMVPWLAAQHRRVLAPGPGTAGHNNASDDAFSAATGVSGDRVLLVDDTFTSGARAQSAASALALAAAECVAVVPVGRIINPEFAEHVKAYWEQQRSIKFDFDTCCLES